MNPLIIKTFLYYTVLICNLALSKKLTLPDRDINSRKLSECQGCKVLVDSFNHWLGKTARGKFEGGDAAWEEAKLRSYSRSEIRLVEIQEGLCSELKKHQDSCYSISEVAEQVLETWWFKNDPNAADLHSWLCIETLKYCCPRNHYGEDCTICPMDENNKVCKGHGNCDGEGTRGGTGECKCHKGFAGKYCEKCAKNYYNIGSDNCQACHNACDGCTGAGVADCVACNHGWLLDNGLCLDIDECNTTSVCGANQYCLNKEGSFSCKSCDHSCKTCTGPGISNCTSCEHDSDLWSGMCVDQKQKFELIKEAMKRLGIYCVILILLTYASRKIRLFSSLAILALAIYIYYSEKSAKVTCLDIAFYHLKII